MQFHQTQKIDLNAQYPCPCCRRKGKLVRITLTEAFGCSRCQQIFVVEEGGYAIEQLPTHHQYKQYWHWNGQSWRVGRPDIKEGYLRMGILISLTILIMGLFYVIVANKIEWGEDRDGENAEGKPVNPQSLVPNSSPWRRPHPAP